MPSLHPKPVALVLTLCLLHLLGHPLAAQTGTSLVVGTFESPRKTFNPWGGVSSTGDLTVPSASQMAVHDDGKIDSNFNFGPGIGVGDLNGDGLPDLVVADANGYFWYFPNHGTLADPKFTTGEVLPIWLGSEQLRSIYHTSHAVVPRIQVLDVDGDGKNDIVAGTYDGILFYLHNTGSTSQPEFRMESQLEDMEIPTYTDNKFWCNYLSPCLVKWFKDQTYYLIMGEGSYSANSIYMLKNVGDNSNLKFNENNRTKIIPGMSREHLTPQVVDWNNDGLPDVICGERTGFIDLFLNKSTPSDTTPTFDLGTHLRIAGRENFGSEVVPCVCDLNNNKLPNLLISNVNGTIAYAKNTGTPGNPQFNTLENLKGKNPYPDIYVQDSWRSGSPDSPYGNSYELLVVTNDQVEPGFKPPPDHQGKNALRSYVYPFENTYFKTRYFLDPNKEFDNYFTPNEHMIAYKARVPLVESKKYRITFNVRTDGEVTETRYKFQGYEQDDNDNTAGKDIIKPFAAGAEWTKISETVGWQTSFNRKGASIGFIVSFRWHGGGSIYLDDISISLVPDE